jgi:FKBP-type peptidyl-prolyl cis-trans isomerase (trigger factor)
MSRSLFKKEVFEFLNIKYDIEIPSDLVDDQLNSVWSEVEEELKTNQSKLKTTRKKKKIEKKSVIWRKVWFDVS